MKILITGAAGFIGSHLCEKLLEDGNTVVGFDNFDPFYERTVKENNLKTSVLNESFKLIEGDIRDSESVKKLFDEHSFEVVVHLAAKAGVRPSIEDPTAYNKVNVLGTLNILEMMKKNDIKRLVFASSSSVYGNSTDVPYKETMNVNNPISPYAATKIAGELLCYNYWHLYKISATCLRFFTVYGPRQRPEMAIAKFVKKAYDGNLISIYGDGSSCRDFTYIEDIIQGVVVSTERDLGFEIINIGESETIDLNSLLGLIKELTGCDLKTENLPMQPGDVDKTFANIDKAKRLLDYAPVTSVREGIKQYISWLRSNSEIRS
ncbi:MAG: SDR family NAD(P)-dependent oxidoreductase [Candidatus Marinimicrobia bacterium]|nr:SDR family NAD(P)-dependent oxidoreductase [Candidatus Neomarinimicrobiota bacterium]MCH7954610.1 SDR family NAD(P)-dependent oxidoreductase [Candidatus Neomarinimicrobiota bacterium]